jgi:hypothetical protein
MLRDWIEKLRFTKIYQKLTPEVVLRLWAPKPIFHSPHSTPFLPLSPPLFPSLVPLARKTLSRPSQYSCRRKREV